MCKANLKIQIGNRLRELRRVLDLTQSEMGATVKEKRAVLGQIEVGKAFPNGSILNNLYNEYNVSVDWLISGKGTMFIDKRIEDLKLRDLFPDIPEIEKWEKLFSILKKENLQSFIRLAALQQDEIVNWAMYLENKFETLTEIQQYKDLNKEA